MRLSKLELSGFKSFANPTIISLPENMIAIVGPNGCGKSNISDALRWVLGAQSAKLLRGKKMDDFIFNGSRNRKPLGMAQVSLTMENGNGTEAVQFPGLESTPEVTVSRRVFRDGEAEYQINKASCRLKDITDLFMDAGVGASILSVIEQGQIEQIISAKPEDRRYIIEESAGISKYKDRKETAQRKLMHTENNLLRVKDIMAEIQRQLNALRRQAKKAERYKQYSDEARELDLAILSTEYQGLAGRLSRLEEELDEARDAYETVSSAYNSSEARLETLRLTITQNRTEIGRLNQEIHNLEKEALRTEADIQSSTNAAEALLAEAGRLSEEIDELNENLSCLKKDTEEKRKEEGELAREAAERSNSFQKLKAELEELTEEHRSVNEKIEEQRSAYIDLMSAVSRERNILNAGEAQQESLSRREARIREEKRAATAALEEHRGRKRESEARLAELRSSISSIKGRRDTLSAEIDALNNELAGIQDEAASLKEEHSRQSGRINSLDELLKSYEGYRDGVKTILSGRENGNGLEGIRGIIADVLETSPRYETAIEAALGDMLQYLVAEDHSQCLRALEYLKSSLGGRSTLIPVNPRKGPDQAAIPADRRGVVGRAGELIRCPEEYRDVFDYLLGNVLVVEDMETALALWNTDSFKTTIVTLEGEVIDSGGAVTGGAAADNSGSILNRKRLLREMKQKSEELETRLKAAAAKRDEYLGLCEARKEELEKVDESLKVEELTGLDCSKELDLIENELQSATMKLKAVDYEEQELMREKNQYLEEQKRARVELDRLLEEKLRSENLTCEMEEKAESVQERLEQTKGKVIREELELSTHREKHTECLFEIQNLLETREEIEQKLALKNGRRDDAKRKRESELNTVQELKSKLADTEKEKSERSKSLTVKKEDYEQAENRLTSQEAEMKSLRAETEDSRERLHDLSMQETELKMQVENLMETTRNRYSADLESEQRELPYELEECRERLELLKDRLERMGEVNMSALSEFEEVNERNEFLTAQHDDLVQSIEDLRQAIEKINRTTRTLFREAHQKINANFKDMFVRLFGGGEAELVLTNESDLLETGVDIIARPPGKRLQNITLLSSGEKALASLALLFGVFLTKPSPFCLLDEVDAPLDEPNIERFTGVLRELSDRTQFIIITHNKRTMTATDLLYGITMEEDGVSKVLSLRLEEAAASSA